MTHSLLPGAPRLLALAAVLCAAACGQAPAPAPMQRPPTPVTVFTAVANDVPLYLDQIGRVVASQSVSIMPRVSGPITSIDFTDGADLAVDAALFHIDDKPYKARHAEAAARVTSAEADAAQMTAARATANERIATAKSRVEEARAAITSARATAEEIRSDVAAAEADAARATADVQRFEGASGAVSSMDLDRMRAESRSAAAKFASAKRREAAAVAQLLQAEAVAKTADAGVREAESLLVEADAKVASMAAAVVAAQAAVETAFLDVGYCTIKAPVAGRAGRRLIDVGNIVKANESVLLSIQTNDPVDVEFTIPEKQLTSVQANLARVAKAKGTLEAEVRIPDDSGEARKGTLAFLDNMVLDATGTVRLRARLANADGRFWPGRFVNVRLVLDTLKGAVMIPSGAAQATDDGGMVFVVKGDSTAELRPVRLGQRQGALVVVSSGLVAGERVIVTGQMMLMPGGPVSVIEPAAAPAAMPGPAAPPAMSEGPGK